MIKAFSAAIKELLKSPSRWGIFWSNQNHLAWEKGHFLQIEELFWFFLLPTVTHQSTSGITWVDSKQWQWTKISLSVDSKQLLWKFRMYLDCKCLLLLEQVIWLKTQNFVCSYATHLAFHIRHNQFSRSDLTLLTHLTICCTYPMRYIKWEKQYRILRIPIRQHLLIQTKFGPLENKVWNIFEA